MADKYLELERMHGVPDVDGHALYVEWTEIAPDSMEGRVHCECGGQERVKGGSISASVETYRLRAEQAEARTTEIVGALQELLGVAGCAHLVVDGPKAGWYDGAWIGDDQPDPNCGVCKAERRAWAVLKEVKSA